MKLVFSNVPENIPWDKTQLRNLTSKIEQRFQSGKIDVETMYARKPGEDVHVKIVGASPATDLAVIKKLTASVFYFLKKHELLSCADVCFMGVPGAFFVEEDFPKISQPKSPLSK